MASNIFIISGISGSGKSTISDALLERHSSISRALTVTTRKPREGERYAYHYYFASEELFDWLITTNQLLEYTEIYSGHRYGTLRHSVEVILEGERDVLFVVDSKGVEQITQLYPNARSVFLRAPNEAEQRLRLQSRGTTGKDLDDRISKAASELAWAEAHGVSVVVNDELERAIAEVERVFSLTT